MSALAWIVSSSMLMSAIALIGSIPLFLKEATLQRIILLLVAFAAGSLIGGAFFHMIPAGMIKYGGDETFYAWVLLGFTVFLGLEQLLHWHHCRRASAPCKQPLTYLILIGDGLHNFLGGLAIAGTFRPGHSKHRRVAGRAEPGRRVGGAVETGAPSRSLRISTGMVHDALQIQMPAVRLGR